MLLLSLLLAEDTGLTDELELKPAGQATPNIINLNFENTLNEPSSDVLYEYRLEDKYAPGETITVNLKIVSESAKVTAVSLVIFGQKIELKEFFQNEWTAHYKIPTFLTRGEYFTKLYIKGPALTVSEKIPLSIDYRITSINLYGNTTVPTKDIYELLPLKLGNFYSDLKAEVGRQKIIDLGNFGKVSYKAEQKNNSTFLKYYTVENPVIKKIDILGSIEFSKQELMNNFSLQTGEVLNFKKLQKDVVTLEKFYKDKEYIFSRVTSVERPTSLNNYSLIFRVNEGHVRSIKIAGNDVTKEYVITREMEMKSGDIFSSTILREDLRKIYNLNYFQTVEPELNYDENASNVDITVNVKEKKTSSVNFGGGYGQIQGWFGFVDLFLDNIMGTAQSVLLKSQFGQNITSYQIKYHNPWMWDNKTSFTAKLWSTYGGNYLTGERELRNGWETEVGFQRSLYVHESYSFKYEDVFNTNDKSKNYLDRAIGYSISYDSRDQWMNPTRGNYDIFSMQHSSSFLGGTIDASRYMLQANRFIPLAEKQVFACRFMYNYAVGNIFSTDQYYVGSDNTVRGYRYIFAKGLQRTVFNFEYRYLFNEMFTGLLFYDIGQATSSVYDPLDDENNFQNHLGWGSGMGFGVRIITPMGPIRLDYGWPQYQEFSDGFLNFNMGNVF